MERTAAPPPLVDSPPHAHSWWRLASVAALVILYALMLSLGDSRAYSGSDAGGKAATAKVMAQQDRSEPDIGYWAGSFDPDGVHHPIVNTQARGGQWVQTTSVPFSIATAWLWGLGGAAAAAILPAAGGVLAAISARRLARSLGAGRAAAETAFWMVGAVGPVGFYATDLWEHAPSAGLVLAFTSVLVAPRGRTDALLAGVAAGLAVVLRAETALVLVGLGAAALLVPAIRRVWFARPFALVISALGAMGPIIANSLLERAYLRGDLRGGRAANLAAGAGSQLFGRLRDAAIETGGPFADDRGLGVAAAAVLLVCALALAAVALGRWSPPRPAVRALVTLGGALYLGRVLMGLGFVPGMVAVAPLAAAGLVAGLRRTGVDPARQVVALGATLSIPCVWMLQWQGNHTAQWGGRYLLSAGALLVVVGTVAVFEQPVGVWYRRSMIALSVLVGVGGIAWHIQRTAEVGRAFDDIASLPVGTTVVSTDPNLLREGGSWYRDGRWLTVTDPATDFFGPDGLADKLGIDQVAILLSPSASGRLRTPGFVRVGERGLSVPGEQLRLVVLRRS